MQYLEFQRARSWSRGGRTVRTVVMLAAVLVASGLAWPATPATAQDGQVVRRLVEYGQMSRRDAQALARQVSAELRANAERGGEEYDRVRKAVNKAVFGAHAGPGQTRRDYFARLDRVFAAMRSGLDASMLELLFPKRDNAAVLCANDFALTVGQCDALVAAAAEEQSALPYVRPDDGSALREELLAHGVDRPTASAVVQHLGTVMLEVPRNLSRDQKGQGLLALLEACPGGIGEREAQIRAWHVGPSVGLARCIAQTLVRRGGAARARQALEAWFGMPKGVSESLLQWGAPARSAPDQVAAVRASAADAAEPVSLTVDQWLERAREHYAAHRFDDAARAYTSAARRAPDDSRVFSGLGASLMAQGDVAGAVRAYRRAVELDPRHAGYYAALGRAFTAAGDRASASRALEYALRLEPGHRGAQEGLAYLQATTERAAQESRRRTAQRAAQAVPTRAAQESRAVPELPQTPSRDAVIQTMRPLKGALEGCAPDFDGIVPMRITIRGETGEISAASVGGDLSGSDQALCMEGIVRSATFPRFAKAELEIEYPYQL